MPHHSICTSIGNTPLISITERIYAKLETTNPSGSIKDRMACYILDRAEERGKIMPGGTIVEATSGNTGIAFSMLAAERGYKMIVVMPSDMSQERKQLIRAFGATIVEVGPGDFAGAVEKRDELVAELSAFCPDQFSNPDNVLCHKNTTGQEILKQVLEIKPLLEKTKISAFVSGTGTGGTLMGVSAALKEKYPDMETVAVEPKESAVMSGGTAGPHSIQGIGDGFIPDIVNMRQVNKVITVSSGAAIERIKRLAKEQGVLVGISAGANICASEEYIEKYNPNGLVITILPDRQERYLSML